MLDNKVQKRINRYIRDDNVKVDEWICKERKDKIKNIGKSWSSTTKEKITKTHLEWFVM